MAKQSFGTSALEAPSLPDGHPMHQLIQTALRGRLAENGAGNGAYWTAEAFGLEKVAAFRRADLATQTAALASCAEGVVREAIFIEKAGITYAGKMVCLAPTFDEKQAYGLIVSEEVAHYQLFLGFMKGAIGEWSDQPFVCLLNEIIEGCEAPVQVYLIQCVLEGWALTYYKRLLTHCQDPAMATAIRRILTDEARHHGSGLLTLKLRELTSSQREDAVGMMRAFLGMIQVGPQTLVSQIEKTLGPLSRLERVGIFHELGAEADTAWRLQHLRRLMLQAGAPEVVEKLEREGCFRAHTAEECATA